MLLSPSDLRVYQLYHPEVLMKYITNMAMYLYLYISIHTPVCASLCHFRLKMKDSSHLSGKWCSGAVFQ